MPFLSQLFVVRYYISIQGPIGCAVNEAHTLQSCQTVIGCDCFGWKSVIVLVVASTLALLSFSFLRLTALFASPKVVHACASSVDKT